MSNPSDQRRSPRVTCDLSVEYEIKGARTQQGRMTNIGTAGTLLTTEGTTPPVGADVLLRFHLPLSRRPVQTVGKVRWSGAGTAGLEFIHLGLQEKDEIWRYYARESARQRTQDAWRPFIRGTGRPPTESE